MYFLVDASPLKLLGVATLHVHRSHDCTGYWAKYQGQMYFLVNTHPP